MADLHLSPSVHHRHLMDTMERPLSYKGGDVKPWQEKLRGALRQCLGHFPQERVPLNPQTLWKRDHELGTIEKVAFACEPYSDAIAFVCLPKNAEPPYRFAICLQGHSTGAHNSIAVDRDTNKEAIEVAGDRDFGIGCMKRGLAALCIEQRSFGERGEKAQEKTAEQQCHDAVCQALKLGRTLAGERIFDVDRGIDYLEQRGDADMSRIGLMGNSGGGTITIYASALLPRVAYAMPSCSFCTYRDSIMSIYHCADNYVPGLMAHAESADIVGLSAPKPVVVVSGEHDAIFPIGPAREAFAQVKRIYEAAGAGDRCHHVVGPEGHRFYADLAWDKMLPEIDRIDR